MTELELQTKLNEFRSDIVKFIAQTIDSKISNQINCLDHNLKNRLQDVFNTVRQMRDYKNEIENIIDSFRYKINKVNNILNAETLGAEAAEELYLEIERGILK